MKEIHIDINCVPIWTSVQLNEARKLEENERYIVRVPT